MVGVNSISKNNSSNIRAMIATYFTLVPCLAYSSLKMEATYSSETSFGLKWTTRRYDLEDRSLLLFIDETGVL
jgi:hypothetical protein